MQSKLRASTSHTSRLSLYLAALLIVLSSVTAYAGEDAQEPLKPRGEVSWRQGNKRSILMTEFWVPLAQDNSKVVYGDVRFMDDNKDTNEGNIGVGVRAETSNAVLGEGVAGGHVWLDRRKTERDTHFHQVTVGAEWFGEKIDLRANSYLPLNSKKTHITVDANASGPVLSGTGIFVDTPGQLIEEAQRGADFEIGLPVKFLEKYADSARVYGGGYYFDGRYSENTAGWRTRIVSDITPAVQLGARVQHDDVRGSQGFLEATLRFPFSAKKSYKKHGLRSRMDESPERDVDIVTSAIVSDSGARVRVINKETGEPQEVLHVDNTAAGGGDGSVERPFNTLADAEAASAAHSIIYIHRGDGTTANQNAGITLNQTGQQLIGAGSAFYFDGSRFTTANGAAPLSTLLLAAGTAPVITNAAGDGITITANDVRLSGIEVNAPTAEGISITDADNLNIENMTVDGAGSRGIFGTYNTAGNTLSISGSSIQNSVAGSGIEISKAGNGSLDATIEGNTITGSSINGIVLQDIGTGTGFNATLLNNTVSGSGNSGINLLNMEDIDVRNNTLNLNADHGFASFNAVSAVLTGNTFTNSGQYGLYVSSTNNATITDNSSTNSGSYGFYLSLINNGTFSGNTMSMNAAGAYLVGSSNNMLTNNAITDNAGVGLLVASSSDNVISNSTISNNTGYGVQFSSSDGNTIDTNVMSNNTNGGVSINIGSSNTIIANSITGGTSGVHITGGTSNTLNNTVRNNELVNNTASGVQVIIPIGLIVDGNTISGSGVYGIYLVPTATATFSASVTDNVINNTANNGIYYRKLVGGGTSDVTFDGNTVTAAGGSGIYVQSGATSAVNAILQNNILTGSAAYGVRISDGSGTQPLIADLGGGSLGSVGYNSIYGNSLEEVILDVDGAVMSAENNWWGVGTGLDPLELVESSGTIDASPFLATDPN